MALFLVMDIFLLLSVLFADLEARSLLLDTRETNTIYNFAPSVHTVFEINSSTLPVIEASVGMGLVDTAKRFMEHNDDGDPLTLRVSSSYISSHNGMTHVYLQQVVNGLDVSNGVGNVNINSKGQTISAGNSFYRSPNPQPETRLEKDAMDAALSLAKLLGIRETKSQLYVETARVSESKSCRISGSSFAIAPIPAQLQYIQTENGTKLVLAWHLQVQTKNQLYSAHVATTSGEVISLLELVSGSKYSAFKFGINDPDHGERSIISDPANKFASPKGWHDMGLGKITRTIGNNAFVQLNPSGGSRTDPMQSPDGGPSLSFVFDLDLKDSPNKYGQASATNVFYWINTLHDLYYLYGFTEAAGNFQNSNIRKGGKDQDPMIVFVQDTRGVNLASYYPGPDGSSGTIIVYVSTYTRPPRDIALDNGVLIHEYTHGLSNRLTGGPANTGCLRSDESRYMAEGWGDFFATIFRTTGKSTRRDDFTFGTYPVNNKKGSRYQPFSTNLEVNSLTYAELHGHENIYILGQIWGEALFEVYWNLVDKYGFEDWFIENGKLKAGNTLMVLLVIDGMKMQPCQPDMVSGRDAILMADKINTNGITQCEIWSGFAKRGLGENAKAGKNYDFGIPKDVCK